MSELNPENSPARDRDTVYFRTATGTRVHLPSARASATPTPTRRPPPSASPTASATGAPAQLNGHGREYFETIEDAMRRVGVPAEAQPIIREALKFVTTTSCFTVHSLTYGALAFQGRPVASFGKTYYWVGGRPSEPPVVRRELRHRPHRPEGVRRVLPGPLPRDEPQRRLRRLLRC